VTPVLHYNTEKVNRKSMEAEKKKMPAPDERNERGDTDAVVYESQPEISRCREHVHPVLTKESLDAFAWAVGSSGQP